VCVNLQIKKKAPRHRGNKPKLKQTTKLTCQSKVGQEPPLW
jgi:hypothetical protein